MNFKVENRFIYRGHECICVLNRFGIRCGYVSVPDEVSYEDNKYEGLIVCHGGLTFAGPLIKEIKPKFTYYIGFDCGHYGDCIDIDKACEYGVFSDEQTRVMKEYKADCPAMFEGVIRSVDFVASQCKSIVAQLEMLKTIKKEAESEENEENGKDNHKVLH